MSKHKIRKDQTCKNCKHVVEKRYCSNCGQENTETRQSFAHLAAHFAEDFTHYDNAFWRTIKFLLFNPGRLTKEFISGKRQSYVPPVKLYIFISFLTFFLLNILATPADPEDDFIKISNNDQQLTKNELGYGNLQEYDSLQRLIPADDREPVFIQVMTRKWLKIRETNTIDQVRTELSRSVMNNLPKVLFVYMPVFALLLWLFHGKKRWFYFDHGIFTLHYFSFLLLTFSAMFIWIQVSENLGEFISDLDVLFIMALMCWWFFYFFRSHRRFYCESKLVSRLKCLALFIINMFFMILFFVGLFIYSIVNIQ